MPFAFELGRGSGRACRGRRAAPGRRSARRARRPARRSRARCRGSRRDARGRRATIARRARDALVEALQAAEPERGARLVEAVVEADVDHVVGGIVAAVAVPGAARHRVGAKQPHALVELLVGAADHAALADAQLLLGEEAERSRARRRCRPGGRRRRRCAPIAWAQSSIRTSPCSSQSVAQRQRPRPGSRRSARRSPRACAAVMRRATSSGSRLKSCGLRTSQRTGSAPT